MKKRMKKLYKFVITGILCVVLMSCFSITSFAASYFRLTVDVFKFDQLYYYYGDLQDFGERTEQSGLREQPDRNGLFWTQPPVHVASAVALEAQESVSLSAGDRIRWYDWSFGGWSGHPLERITVRLVGVRNGEYVYINLGKVDYGYFEEHTYHFSMAGSQIDLTYDFTLVGIEILYMFSDTDDVFIDMSINKGSPLYLDIGDPTDPGFPAYPSPGDPGTGELDNVENQIMGQLDKDSFTETLEGIGVLGTTNFYGQSLLFASRVLTTALDEIPFLIAIVRLSLAIGIVSFLFGIMSLLKSSSERSDIRKQQAIERKERAAVRKAQSNYYASRRK